ncbi:hypothetical protein Tco_0527768 [Tanacetum coccineum]
MCTCLKNMKGYKLKDLMSKGFDFIQEMFDRAFKRVNTFEDFSTELVEGKEKRIRAELVQESTKKQKVEDDKETTDIKKLMEIIPDEEEVAIDAIPLAVKSPSIVDWKIHKEGRKSYYQITRADGKSQMYMIFSHMLKSFDMEDLETLYKLVKAKYESTRPVEDLDLLLWGNLKTMFEPHVEDAIWTNQQGYKVLEWKLYDSCGVHSLMMQHVHIYMLVEKKYPLAPLTLSMMLEKKLKIDYESEMAYQLLKFIMNQLKKRISSLGRIVGIKSLLDDVRNTVAQVYVNIALMKRRIIVVTRHKIMKMYDYDHLEQIEVRRDDQKLYTFKEGDFKRLRLHDIEDMLLLLIQQKLTNLTIDERDGTLNDVRTALHDIAARIIMEYLSMSKWSNLDKKRAQVMVQDIDRQLYQRRLMRNLEMFVGGRIYGKDLRLLESTI